MRRRDRAFLFLATLWLCAGVARAQTPRDGAAKRSPQEEKRRKLLEEIGLDKKDAPAPQPSILTNPSPLEPTAHYEKERTEITIGGRDTYLILASDGTIAWRWAC